MELMIYGREAGGFASRLKARPLTVSGKCEAGTESRSLTLPLRRFFMRMFITVSLAAGLLISADIPKGDLGQLQGTWKVFRAEHAAEDFPTFDGRLIIQGDRFTEFETIITEGVIKLDRADKPRCYEKTALRFGGRESKNRTRSVGFCALEGDRYKECSALPGGDPPTEISSKFGLALASWCAGSALRRPCLSVPGIVAPGELDPDARYQFHRCAARLPGRPRPPPPVATNSSPGACNVLRPPSRCISPLVCLQSITPLVAVADSWGCTLDVSPGRRSAPRLLRGSSPTPLPLSQVRSRHLLSLPTVSPAVPSRTHGDDPWGRPRNSSVRNIVSGDATSTRSSL